MRKYLKIMILSLIICILSYNLNAQIVNIPDANLKAALVGNIDINTNSDSEIQTTEAIAFSGTLNVNSLSISDLTGIEAFTSINILYCRSNQLTSLNLSANTALTELSCRDNQITSLNLSTNTALKTLYCYNNQLTSLNLSNNSALTYLDCKNNHLTSLNLSSNTLLNYLDCGNNQLVNLNLSANASLTNMNCVSNQLISLNLSNYYALTDLDCSWNSLTSLNLTNNNALTNLNCWSNQLTSLNLSTNTALSVIYCHYNQLISLNFFANNALTLLDCSYNQLTSLNVKNGNNINFSWFYATNNIGLNCIQVDNTTFMNNNWASSKDAIAIYNEECFCVANSSSSNTTIIACNSYLWTDGNTYATSGTYTQTLTNSAGCDSIATLELTINVSTSSTSNVTSCTPYTWTDGNTYATSGTYQQIFVNSVGCDSIINLNLTIPPKYNIDTNIAICEGDSIILGTQILKTAGVYEDSLLTVFGCDSIVSINLTVNPIYTINEEINICQGENYILADSSVVNSSDVYTVTLSSSTGCDSIIVTNLIVNPIYENLETVSICEGENYTLIDGTVVDSANTYTVNYNTISGCDSSFVTNLILLPKYDIDTTISICEGDSLIWNLQILSTAGTYTDTLISVLGCDSIVTINLIVNPTPITSISIINSTCSGFSNGVAEVTVSGGTSPYSYNWSNGQTTLQIVNLSAGIYYITVTDINGCFVIDSATINQPDEIIPNITVGNVTCYGGSDGYCTISSSGGTAPYSYYWSNGINDDVISNLTIGTYNVTITDANNCIVSDTAIVTQPLQIYISGSVTNSTGSNGAIDITVINGISPYTYLWSNAAVTEDISGLAIGNYSVTVTDSIGCTRLKTFTVNFDCSGLNVNLSATNCTSNQISDGSIFATVSGGTTPYIYNWTNGSNYTNIENLSVGQYCITVTDFNNCQKIKCANINADTIFGNYYINSSTTVEVCISAIHTFVSDLGFYLLAPGFGQEQLNDTVTGQAGIVELLPTVSNWQTVTQLPISVISCTTFDINTNCNSGNNVTDFCFTTTLSAGNPSYTACVCDLPTPLTGDYASAGPWSTVYGFPIDVGGWSVMITDCEAIDVGAYSNITLKFVQGTNQYFYNSGSISLEITDNTCISQSTNIYTFALLPVSVNLPSIENNNILIYPNPATDEVFVENSKPQISNSKFQEKMEYRIYSIEGRKVKEGNLEAPKTRISTKDLESGVYFIEVNIGNEKVNSKLVITK